MARLRRRLRSPELAEETVPHVLSESTRANIEKMAEEFAREMMADPVYREQLREAVRELARECAREPKDFSESLARRRKARERRSTREKKTQPAHPDNGTLRMLRPSTHAAQDIGRHSTMSSVRRDRHRRGRDPLGTQETTNA